MENKSLKVDQSFLEYLTERNLEKLTNLFSENVDWFIPGDESKAVWFGSRNSKRDVSDFYMERHRTNISKN